MQQDNILDVRGMQCPMPLLKLKLHLKKHPTQAALHLLVSDPASVKDIPAWAENKGYKVVCQQINPRETAIIITSKE